jgi:hypothetical protein
MTNHKNSRLKRMNFCLPTRMDTYLHQRHRRLVIDTLHRALVLEHSSSIQRWTHLLPRIYTWVALTVLLLKRTERRLVVTHSLRRIPVPIIHLNTEIGMLVLVAIAYFNRRRTSPHLVMVQRSIRIAPWMMEDCRRCPRRYRVRPEVRTIPMHRGDCVASVRRAIVRIVWCRGDCAFPMVPDARHAA